MLSHEQIAALTVGTKVRVYDEHFPQGRNGRVVKVDHNVISGTPEGVRNIGTVLVFQFSRDWEMATANCKLNQVELGWKRSSKASK